MGSRTDKIRTADEKARGFERPEPPGLYWGWLVVASGFYCVTMEGGVGDIMIMTRILMTTVTFIISLKFSPGFSWKVSNRIWHQEAQQSFHLLGGFRYYFSEFLANKKRFLKIFCLHFVSPIASMLMTRHGGHLMCMSGAMMATVGFLSTSYVTDIPLLILFYSVLTGLGVGLMYIPSIVACVPYFTKNR